MSKVRTCLRRAFVQIALLIIGACSILAQENGEIVGTITTAENGDALPGTNISIRGTMRGGSAGMDGKYRISIPPGKYTLKASFIGYLSVQKSVTVKAGERITVNFQLAESAVMFGDALVVIGSRTTRTAIETPVPVDVISSADIRDSGQPEVNQMLATLAPSFSASHQTISDGTDHINPASLRGLGPDQVLVLVNGSRRHQTALTHVNGTFGRGTVGVDLNAIPTAAIERIEVLRDGAAAQYGSDAIAGVINIVLKEQTENVEVNTSVGITGEGDGEVIKTDVNYGFRVGEHGFFNITAEFLDRARTNRSETYTGPIYFSEHPTFGYTDEIRNADDERMRAAGLTRDDFTMKTGQSAADFGAAFFNSEIPLTGSAEFYTFGGYSHRSGAATGFYRLPNQEERVVFDIFPNGFLPEIHTEIVDNALTAGVRGARRGWDVDFSLTHGENAFQFNIENTNNASLGAASPTSFDAGRLRFAQTVGNFDAVRFIKTDAVKSLSLVAGGEFRVENYRISAGEDASWQLGNGGSRPGIDFDTTATGAPKNPGSQVFAGFQPDNEVNRFRNSISAYAGFESQITDALLIDVGGRFENYSDFGNRVIGKLATRLELTPQFALRGAVSTGFRAPSLHQVWFNNVSIQFVIDPNTGALEPSRVLTASNHDPVTKAFGIPELTEETSVNFSAGFTARPLNNFSITADGYLINIDDRIVLSSRFSDSDATVAQILSPFQSSGVGAAQFFANAVDTETMGLDVVASYGMNLGAGRLNVTASANFTKTEVLNTNIPQSVADVFSSGDLAGVRNTLFNREERNRLEDALPREKGNLSLRYNRGKFNLAARASYFGEIYYKPTNPANDEIFNAKTIFDLDLAYELFDGVRWSVGGNNILNTFPDRQTVSGNISSGRFPYSRRVTQFGINGGFYYSRLRLDL